MKQLIFAILLAIGLASAALFVSHAVADNCDELANAIAKGDDPNALHGKFEKFSHYAAMVTSYDLIRAVNSDWEHYFALLRSDADPADLKSARMMLESSIREIKRVHTISWELIF